MTDAKTVIRTSSNIDPTFAETSNTFVNSLVIICSVLSRRSFYEALYHAEKASALQFILDLLQKLLRMH